MNILNNRLTILLACWFLGLIFLFCIIEQGKPANQKFDFIKLFYSPDVKQLTPLIPELQHNIKGEIKEVENANPLLPKGYDAGSGSIGEIDIEYQEDGSFIIIVPYKGTLKNYANAEFIKGNIRARILHFKGQWEMKYFQQLLDTGYCARLVQIAKQKNEMRISICAANGIFAVEEEVRYTDSEIIIHISKQKGKERTLPNLYEEANPKIKSELNEPDETDGKEKVINVQKRDSQHSDGTWYNLFHERIDNDKK